MLKLATYKKDNAKTITQEYAGLNPHLDHKHLLQRYFESHRMQNHSSKTIIKEKNFLNSWFELHSTQNRILFTWEAMKPIIGRKRIMDYANALIDSGLSANTIRSYLGSLSRYFSYTLEYPYFIEDNSTTLRIQERYTHIEQPVSEYDYPKHVYNGEQLGIPLDPEKLYDFYSLVRTKYLLHSRYLSISARNYSMLVLAGESGLRIDEIFHLELADLFFESNKLQTRFAKGTNGSGKRSRVTFFTPLAQDTIKYYLKVRPQLIDGSDCKYLFPSKSGKIIDYSSAHSALKTMTSIAQKEKFPVLSHLSWHWMRRLFATRFIERFPNRLSELVSLLGHVTPNTVHCYIRHSEPWMDSRINKMLEGGFSCLSNGN
jgi:integrase